MPDAPTDFHVDVKFSVADLRAITKTAVDNLAKDLQSKERSDVSSHGMARFARRTRVAVKEIKADKGGGWQVEVRARPGWMRAWEYGATSVGKPMLWFPVIDSLKGGYQRARQFMEQKQQPLMGKRLRGRDRFTGGSTLWRPPGKNVLIDKKTGKVWYVGVRQTSIQPRLDMRSIAEQEAQRFVENLTKDQP